MVSSLPASWAGVEKTHKAKPRLSKKAARRYIDFNESYALDASRTQKVSIYKKNDRALEARSFSFLRGVLWLVTRSGVTYHDAVGDQDPITYHDPVADHDPITDHDAVAHKK